jgi:hypothetical protein
MLEESYRDFIGKLNDVTRAKSLLLDELRLERIGMDKAVRTLLRV